MVVVFGRAITGAVMGRANGVGGLDEVVDVDLMLALSAGNKKLKFYFVIYNASLKEQEKVSVDCNQNSFCIFEQN